MHKRRVNELSLSLTIRPDGPILIKSGVESGADPTLPSMNFVRTHHSRTGARTIYLPGASLKGVLRSHSERIVRTVLGDDPSRCCDPLDQRASCSRRITSKEPHAQYRELCLTCRLFGAMMHASHFLIADAYPAQAINDLPVRQNVAIDRLSGGVAVGPFDMEVALEGAFETRLQLHNFETWQLGLLALALRDLKLGQVRLGFGKSRGLGLVQVALNHLEIAYPAQFISGAHTFQTHIYGVGALTAPEVVTAYDYRAHDSWALPVTATADETGEAWGRPAVHIRGDEAITAVLQTSVQAWASLVQALSQASP